ncbi:hypothetical protein LXA43DRAFT_1121514 [Ganoderma leucocontextum]|nr:hypothetical protein LXA43DRAFT_1121514 [Ganoderma leucocontextum]
MSYDLFSLTFVPRQEDRNIIDLVDPKGVAYYTKRRVPTSEYRIEVYDTLSESLLASVSAPSATSKHKTLQLHNPDSIVELRSTGVLTFKWGFKWEEHDFEWKREECFMVRKPDPAVLVAQTKEPPGKLQTRNVQILDYNINRFDINDRKGLEITILTALLTFSDLNEAHHAPIAIPATIPAAAPASAPVPQTSVTTSLSATVPPPAFIAANRPPPTDAEPPAVPPRPAPRTGVERVAEMHAVRNAVGEGDVNEVEVWEECDVIDYAQYAERLLNDEAMLFISIRSASQLQVPKVLKVVEETKRLRYKAGIEEEEELHQYVIYETDKPQRKPPRRINLDDPNPRKGKAREPDIGRYAPPTSLTVHLSKIDMPELRPSPNVATRRRSSGSNTPVGRAPSPQYSLPPPPPPVPVPVPLMGLSEKERKRMEKESRKMEKERERAEKESRRKDKARRDSYFPQPSLGPPPPSTNKLSKPSPSPSPHPPYHTPAHMPHPYQPSPSPAQLGNPAIYAAPPTHQRQSSFPRPESMAFPQPPSAAFSQLQAQDGLGRERGRRVWVGRRKADVDLWRAERERERERKGPVSALLHMWSKD